MKPTKQWHCAALLLCIRIHTAILKTANSTSMSLCSTVSKMNIIIVNTWLAVNLVTVTTELQTINEAIRSRLNAAQLHRAVNG